MTPNAREVVLEDPSTYAPLIVVFGTLAGAIAVGAGVMVNGKYAIPLIVLGVVVVALMVFSGIKMRTVGVMRLCLTERGLVQSNKQSEWIVPAEAIEAVGLFRDPSMRELLLWYDRAKLPELPKPFRRREKRPGQIRLAVVLDEAGGLPSERVREVRLFVQEHKLGEWRNRKASWR